MWGAKLFSSTLICRWFSASQCASRPSPSDVASPMPVIQASIGAGCDDVSAMSNHLLGKPDTLGHDLHVPAQIRVWEGGDAERDCRIAPRLAADADFGLGDGVTGAFVNDTCLDAQKFAGSHKSSHLGFLDRGKKRHALKLHQRDQQPAV